MTRVTRDDAIVAVSEALDAARCLAHIVFANGFISRDGYDKVDRPRNFYMLGSMGLAGAIGLGVSLVRSATPVVVVDGDGNLLMGLGIMPMIGAWGPRLLLHVVLDNGVYSSTGGQPSVAHAIDFVAMALSAGYRAAVSAADSWQISNAVQEWCNFGGPFLLHVPIDPHEGPARPRVGIEPAVMARRFANTFGS